jgi:hypothetical protein
MATTQKKSKQYVANHYVSQCYLRGFIDPKAKKEKVWAYGCYKGDAEVTVNLVRISQTALVNNLYGVDDTERAQLEEQFKIVEDLFPPIRAKLNSHGELSKIEVGILTTMFLLHMVRNPSWAADNLAHAETIRKLLPQLQSLDPSSQSELLANANKKWGTNYSWNEFLTFLSVDPALSRNTDKENLHHGLKRLPAIVNEHFSKTSWMFLTAPIGESFVTSDNPLFWNSPRDVKMVFQQDEGLQQQLKAEFVMTISPTIAAAGLQHPDGKVYYPIYDAISKETCREVNNLLIRNRNRFVYAHQKSDDLVKQIQAIEGRRLR